MNVVEDALVKAVAWSTVKVNDCVAALRAPFEAVIVIGYVPPVPADGVPESVPLVANVTPDGRVPDSVKEGVGYPPPVTEKVPATPAANVTEETEVIDGAASMVSANDCVAVVPTPLEDDSDSA